MILKVCFFINYNLYYTNTINNLYFNVTFY